MVQNIITQLAKNAVDGKPLKMRRPAGGGKITAAQEELSS
jgi:hypothetical protein